MKIIYTTETGIAIIHSTGKLSIEQIFQKDIPDQYKSTAHIVKDEYLPSDRTYRDAWQHDINDNVHSTSENLDKAKEIHKTKLTGGVRCITLGSSSDLSECNIQIFR